MFRYMDQQEIEIIQIDDLKMVHFYRLVSDSEGIPAAAIIYGDNRQLSYCKNDKYYELFLNKICEVYSKQKDKSSIIMDDNTEAILSAFSEAEQDVDEKRFSVFKHAEVKDVPDLFPQSYMDHIIMPIVMHYIGELYGMYEKHLVWRKLEHAWHGRGSLVGFRGNQESCFPYELRHISDNEYDIRVGNFLISSHPVVFRVIFSAKGIKVTFEADAYDINGVSTLTINPEKGYIDEYTTVISEGKAVYIDNDIIHPINEAEKQDFLDKLEEDGVLSYFKEELDNAYVVKLPWGMYLSFTEENHSNEETWYQSTFNMLSYLNNEFTFIRDYNYKRIKNTETGISIDLASYAMESYIDKNSVNRIQIFFDDSNMLLSGKLKEELRKKYFYFYKNIEQIGE